MPLEEEVRKVLYLNFIKQKNSWFTRVPVPEELKEFYKTKTGKFKTLISKQIKASSAKEIQKAHDKNCLAIEEEFRNLKNNKSSQIIVQMERESSLNANTKRKRRPLYFKGDERLKETLKDPLLEELNKIETSFNCSDSDLREWLMNWYENYFHTESERLRNLYQMQVAVNDSEQDQGLFSDQIEDVWMFLNMLKHGINVFEPNDNVLREEQRLEVVELRRILIERRTNLDPNSTAYKKALRLIRGIMIDVVSWQFESLKSGDVKEFFSNSLEEAKCLKVDLIHTPSSSVSDQIKQSNMTIEELFEKFEIRKTKKDCPENGYWEKFKFVRSLAVEMYQNSSIASITRDDVLDLRNNLSYMPIKRADQRLKVLTLLERCELSKKENLLRPVHDTANRQLQILRNVFEYGERERLVRLGISEELKDVFNDKNRKGNISREKDRRAFTEIELEMILSNPVFSGCAGRRGKKRRLNGEKIFWNRDYWGPLIALFSGMRPKEIWQIRVSQIKEQYGITYFHVNDEYDEQSVKTGEKGFRKIPIHPTLIEFGLLEYIKERSPEDYMIHDMAETKANNKTRFFTRYFLQDIVKVIKSADDELLTDFYSFRHTFASRADEQGITDRELYSLCGWSIEDSFYSNRIDKRYTKSAYTLKRDKESIEKINYPSIDFEMLKLDNLKRVGHFEFEVQ